MALAGSLQHIRIQMIILLGPSAHGPLVTSVRWLRLPKFGEFSSVEWVGGRMKPAIVRTSRCFFLSRRDIYIYTCIIFKEGMSYEMFPTGANSRLRMLFWNF